MNSKRKVAVVVLAILVGQIQVSVAAGAHGVRGHVKKDGTYVQPHQQTNPNKSKADNWSSQGNVNPYTGKAGTVDPYAPSPPKPARPPRP
jgi:hypothetical protein